MIVHQRLCQGMLRAAIVAQLFLTWSPSHGAPSVLAPCELSDLQQEIQQNPYPTLARLIGFGTGPSKLAHDLARVSQSEKPYDNDLLRETLATHRLSQMNVISSVGAGEILKDLKKASPLAPLMDINQKIGFLSYSAYASLATHGDRGWLAIGDEHDLFFHLPSLADPRNVRNLKQRSALGLRHFTAILNFFERRGASVKLTPNHFGQGFQATIQPYDPELNELLNSAEVVFDHLRFMTWEHLPAITTDEQGVHHLRLWGGMGHNLALFVEPASSEERFHKLGIKWILNDSGLLTPMAFFFPKENLLWRQFAATAKPSFIAYEQKLNRLGIDSKESLATLTDQLAATIHGRRPDQWTDDFPWQLWFLSELTQAIGNDPKIRVLFDYEKRQELAEAALKVYADFVDFSIRNLERLD